MTQAELAETLHYTAQTISNWERGVSSPDSETLLMLAEFFGVTTDELLGKESVSDETTGFSSSVSGKSFQHTKSTDYYAESTSAALALRVLLWISVGLAALLVLLVWLRTPAALVIFAVLSIGFRLLYLVDFVVLLTAKEWVGKKVVKTFFLGALLCGNVVSVFTENVPELVYLQVALSLTLLITAPFVFCPASEDPGEVRRGRKIYFVGIVILFLFEIISAIGGSVVFETFSSWAENSTESAASRQCRKTESGKFLINRNTGKLPLCFRIPSPTRQRLRQNPNKSGNIVPISFCPQYFGRRRSVGY